MFAARDLEEKLAALREDVAPEARVLDCEREFESMPAEWLYELALITEDLAPLSHPDEWVPADAPPAARRTTGGDPAIGMPDDGSVTWTRQTVPPLVLVKPRAGSLSEGFRSFLIAEALVELGADHPETPICFFESTYVELHDLVGTPALAFRLAAALRAAWIGLDTRERFAGWRDDRPELHAAWREAGDRLVERVAALPDLQADGTLGFAEATELACSAVKHDLEFPAPFAALDVEAYRDGGPAFARRWLAETYVP